MYYAEDMLGSSRVMVQSNGTLCYDADFHSLRRGSSPYTNTCPQNYKFEGKERDTETQNDDFGARYYSWRFGRWLSSDWSSVPVAVPYANLTNPQTLNLYSMVADDPESFADLDGHNWWDILTTFMRSVTVNDSGQSSPGVNSAQNTSQQNQPKPGEAHKGEPTSLKPEGSTPVGNNGAKIFTYQVVDPTGRAVKDVLGSRTRKSRCRRKR